MRRLFIAATVVVALALVGDLAARLVHERRLEGWLNAREDIDNAVLTLDAWPFTLNSGDNTFPKASLSLTVQREGFQYTPIDLHLRSFYYYRNDQCRGRTRYLVGASDGTGEAFVTRDDLMRSLEREGFSDVDVSDEAMVVEDSDGQTFRITDAAIRPNDISGDIVLPLTPTRKVLIRLPEPVDGVKFKDVIFEDGGVRLPFTIIDPELACV